ncbi:MAG: nuclear transport factor 2 family protein [Pseudomonadota bacterium]
MTSDEANVEKLRSAYATYGETKGKADVWYDVLADTISWGSLADGRPGMDFTRTRVSKEEVVSYFEGLANDWTMEFYFVNEFVAQNDRVVALAESGWKNRKTGKIVKTPKADIWKFRDGKAIEFMEFYDTQAALEATQP